MEEEFDYCCSLAAGEYRFRAFRRSDASCSDKMHRGVTEQLLKKGFANANKERRSRGQIH